MQPEPRCSGCGCAVGEVHDQVCDIARCRASGLQWHRCDHDIPAEVPHERDRWTGRWPGEAECEEFGWYARLVPGQGWVACAADDSGAQPDLNRLLVEADWDPHHGRWTLATREASADS